MLNVGSEECSSDVGIDAGGTGCAVVKVEVRLAGEWKMLVMTGHVGLALLSPERATPQQNGPGADMEETGACPWKSIFLWFTPPLSCYDPPAHVTTPSITRQYSQSQHCPPKHSPKCNAPPAYKAESARARALVMRQAIHYCSASAH